MVMDSEVDASLHPHCHRQLIFAKLDLKVFYPTSYDWTVWHFPQANSDHIKRAVDLFNCESALIDLDVNEQVFVSNDAITNIMSNFLPNKIISFENRDSPWMNCHIKNLIFYKTNFYTTFIHGKNSMFHYLTFNNLQNHLDQSQQTFVLMKTPWRRLEDVFRLRLQKTSWSRRICSP